MDFVAGAPLSGLHGAAVLRRAPSLVRTVPVQLAEIMASLHRLDPDPITDAVHRAAPDVAWTVPDVVGQLRLGRGGDRTCRRRPARLDRLAARIPVVADPVICHGDLHPFNVLSDADGLTLVGLDRGAAGRPMLRHRPHRTAACQPAARAARLPPHPRRGQVLGPPVRHGAYQRAKPAVSLARGLEWFRALHSARVSSTTRGSAPSAAPAGGHPLRLVAPAAARHLVAATGVAVTRVNAARR